ncbi:MAG: NADP oxidoreductase [Spirochaetes bacterium]|nr:MAG: NADP oxidoreductase [Spirochaetota bacterium]
MMANLVDFKIDGKECMSEEGQYLLSAARDNGVYIPSLCNYEGIKPKGSCRMCTVRVNGNLTTACTTRVFDGLEIENMTDELEDLRKGIVELMFTEGNHFCPSCEKSGFCELQALGYRYRIGAPRFPYLSPDRPVESKNPKLMKDQNRCILCKRCIRAIKDEKGKSLFAFKNRGYKVVISCDTDLAAGISDEMAQKAMDICPVGAILKKRKGFDVPIGNRPFDKREIGSEVGALR